MRFIVLAEVLDCNESFYEGQTLKYGIRTLLDQSFTSNSSKATMWICKTANRFYQTKGTCEFDLYYIFTPPIKSRTSCA